jgi:hypothetical protein
MKQRKSAAVNNSRANSSIGGNNSINEQREEQGNIGFGGLGNDDNLMVTANEGGNYGTFRLSGFRFFGSTGK